MGSSSYVPLRAVETHGQPKLTVHHRIPFAAQEQASKTGLCVQHYQMTLYPGNLEHVEYLEIDQALAHDIAYCHLNRNYYSGISVSSVCLHLGRLLVASSVEKGLHHHHQ